MTRDQREISSVSAETWPARRFIRQASVSVLTSTTARIATRFFGPPDGVPNGDLWRLLRSETKAPLRSGGYGRWRAHTVRETDFTGAKPPRRDAQGFVSFGRPPCVSGEIGYATGEISVELRADAWIYAQLPLEEWRQKLLADTLGTIAAGTMLDAWNAGQLGRPPPDVSASLDAAVGGPRPPMAELALQFVEAIRRRWTGMVDAVDPRGRKWTPMRPQWILGTRACSMINGDAPYPEPPIALVADVERGPPLQFHLQLDADTPDIVELRCVAPEDPAEAGRMAENLGLALARWMIERRIRKAREAIARRSLRKLGEEA